ncbi:MAG: tRNA lysidine(34) synthetase TilS [Oscillospiraceae bacterium]
MYKDPVIQKLLELSEKHNMLPRGSLILAAVSGGADSMCLLAALLSVSGELGIRVAAAHYNHRIRGESSDGDENFVADFCRENGVQCCIGSGDVLGTAAETSRGVEETAREMRYAFFEETAVKIGASRIATAHTACDNAETVLLNITRGAGLRGLCGIPPVRGKIVRPLLAAARGEIEEYLRAKNIPHREDATNAEDIYTRNRIRHSVIPVLSEINPAFFAGISSMTELLAGDEDYLTSLAEDFIKKNSVKNRLPVSGVLSLPLSVSRRVIRLFSGRELSQVHVGAVLDLCRSECPSSEVQLPGITVLREYGDIVFGERPEREPFKPFFISPGERAVIPGTGLTVSCGEAEYDSKIHKSFNTFLFKKSAICGRITIRSRSSGDKIALLGRNGTKSLKKAFIEHRIPAKSRDYIPVVADEDGILAVFGLGPGTRAAASPGDKVLKISFEENILK